MLSNRLALLAGGFALMAGVAACSDSESIVASDANQPRFAHGPGNGDVKSDKSGMLYTANLHTLNPQAQRLLDPDRDAGGTARGKAFFRITGDNVQAIVQMQGVEPGMPHPQHIHAADRCPPASADVNGDGFVDVLEGVPFYGPILITLDRDITNTTTAAAGLPAPDVTYYNYVQNGSLSAIEAAIGEPLALESRHVVIHGVDLNTPLPATVASIGGLPAQLTLPIACGTIKG